MSFSLRFHYSGVKEDSFFLMTFCSIPLVVTYFSFFLLVMQNLYTLTCCQTSNCCSLAGFFSIWSSWRCLSHAWWIKSELWCVIEFYLYDHLGFDEWFLLLFLLLHYIIRNCIFKIISIQFRNVYVKLLSFHFLF